MLQSVVAKLPASVNRVELPAQKLGVPVIFGVGAGLVVVVRLAVRVQPVASVAVTV